MKKPLVIAIFSLSLFAGAAVVFAAPPWTYQPTLLPNSNDAFDLGTSTDEWRSAYIKNLTLTGTCTGCGGGTSYPFPLTGNATSSLTQFNGGLTAFASSTIGNGTLGLTVNGTTTLSGNSSAIFQINYPGTSTPFIQFDNSVANSGIGLLFRGQPLGTNAGMIIQPLSVAPNEDIGLASKGAGAVRLRVGATDKLVLGNGSNSMTSISNIFSASVSNTAATVRFSVTNPTDAALTASTEAPDVYFALANTTRTHATGSYALQRDFRISGSTHVFAAGGGTITDAAAFSVDSPTAGNLATFTNAHNIYIPAASVVTGTGSVVNSYGLTVNTQTGATNNYAAQFLGGNVGIGSSSPESALTVVSAGATTATFFRNSTLNNANEMRSQLGSYFYGISSAGAFAIGQSANLASSPDLVISSTTGMFTLNTMTGVDNPGVIRLGRLDSGSRFHEISSEVSGTAANNWLDFALNLGTATSSVMRLTGSGNVGIGSTSPFARLSITGSDTSNTTRGVIFADSTDAPKAIFTNGGQLVMATTTLYNVAIPLQIGGGTGGTNLFARFCREDATFGCTFFGSGNGAFAETAAGSAFFTWLNGGAFSAGSFSGGTQDMALRSGTLLIGTSTNNSSTGGHLDIWGKRGFTDYFQINNADAGTATTIGDIFKVDGTGNVGIGTTTAWAQLSVNPNGISGPAFAIGSTTKTLFQVANSGEVVGTDIVTSFTGRITPTHHLSLTTGTTTTWTASTTGTAYSPFVVAPFSGTVQQVYCATDATGLGVNLQIAGSNVTPSYFVASTTVGNVLLTAGNTFTKGQKILANFGTTTTSTATTVSCTLDIVETP